MVSNTTTFGSARKVVRFRTGRGEALGTVDSDVTDVVACEVWYEGCDIEGPPNEILCFSQYEARRVAEAIADSADRLDDP